jgi:uncharacterized protein (DUF58 family)
MFAVENRAFLPLRILLPRLKVTIRFTREGAVFIILSLAIGAAAVNTGNNILYLIFSLMLGLIVVSGMISRRMLSGLNPAIDFPDKIFSQTPSVCYMTLKNNKKAVPSLGIRIALPRTYGTEISRYFFYIPPGSSVSAFTPAVFHQRGLHLIKEIELQTRFPFSFFLKVLRQPIEREIRVYPRVYRLPEEMISKFTEGLLVESPYRGDSAHLLHLRDYSPLDSTKRIHWKASAKSEKLLVKEFQREHGRDVFIYFDCYPGRTSQVNSQEIGLSLLASFAFVIQEKGMRARFCFPDSSFVLENGENGIYRLLNYLSEVTAARPDAINYMAPSKDAFVLHVRSLAVAPILLPQWPNTRQALIEDFADLIKAEPHNQAVHLKEANPE